MSVFSPLIILMGFIGASQSQFGNCDYEQIIEAGRSYYVFNPGYPSNYKPGTLCRWTATSDRPVQLTCNNFNLPASPRCNIDVVVVNSANKPGQRYCGNGTFTVVSEGNQLIVSLYSSRASPGGSFLCTLQTATKDDESCKCGWKNPSKIVGGQDTGVNEYPMMAGIIDVKDSEINCGATIINPKQLLTAAHCLYGKSAKSLGIVVGEHDVSTNIDTKATMVFRIVNYTIHPQWSELIQTDYDIAIITIDGTIKFTEQIGPACLPFQHSADSFAGNFVDLLGWGNIEFAGAKSQTLQKVQVSIVTNKNCKRTFQDVGSRQICHYRAGKDACQADSGGPVLWQNPTTRRVVLIGIISYGNTCAEKDPAVNSRVGAFIDWIIQQTVPGSEYCEAE